MAVRQYIGARYVPKLEGEWTNNTEYEALTIVTYNNASYTSKIPVPANIGNPLDNPTYWVCTGNYNAQMAELQTNFSKIHNALDGFLISAHEGDDITDLILDGLQRGNITLDGKNYTIRPFTMPDFRQINGNGSVLTVVNDGTSEWAITVGNTRASANNGNTLPGVFNISLDCQNNINGIKALNNSTTIQNVKVFAPNPKGIQLGEGSGASDCQCINCVVFGRFAGGCENGFISITTDNSYINCRTLFTRISFSSGSGDFFYYCHALGLTLLDESDVKPDTVGFLITTAANLVSCYSDECFVGISILGSRKVIIDGFTYYLYTPESNVIKHAINIDLGSYTTIKNTTIFERDDIINLYPTNNLAWQPTRCNIDFTDSQLGLDNVDEYASVARYQYDKEHSLNAKPFEAYPIAELFNPSRLAVDNSDVEINIRTNVFSLSNLIGHVTTNNGNLVLNVGGEGQFNSNASGATFTFTIVKKDGRFFVCVNHTNAPHSVCYIKLNGTGIKYIKRDIDISNGEVIQTIMTKTV